MAKKVDDGRLSMTQYGKLLGRSKTAVSDAIKTGKIVKGYDGKKIIVAIANEEWGNITKDGKDNPSRQGVSAVKDKVKKCRKCGCTDEHPCKTNEGRCHWVQPDLCSECIVHTNEVKKADQDEWAGEPWTGGEVPTNIPYKEALRIDQILKAEQTRIKNDELMGQLVRKDDIKGQLAIAGMEIRKLFERFPAAVIDDILGAKDRADALRVFDNKVLELLGLMGPTIEAAIKENIQNSETI